MCVVFEDSGLSEVTKNQAGLTSRLSHMGQGLWPLQKAEPEVVRVSITESLIPLAGAQVFASQAKAYQAVPGSWGCQTEQKQQKPRTGCLVKFEFQVIGLYFKCKYIPHSMWDVLIQ